VILSYRDERCDYTQDDATDYRRRCDWG